MTENTVEDIDKDTLVSLLKEKGKEIKSLENKNKKLEERYVKVFRENKNLVKDKDTLEKLLKIILEKDQARFSNVESGSYDLTVLTELWNQRNAEKSTVSNEVFEKLKNELEKKINSLQEELNKAHSQSPEIEKRVESHKHHALELEKANEKLSQEIKELNNVIEERDQQIVQLRKVENEMELLKAEMLMKELESKTFSNDLSIKVKMQENDRKNEVLRLRQQVESLQLKVKEFESEKEDGKTTRFTNSKSQCTQTEVQPPASPPNHARFEAAPPLHHAHHSGSSDTSSRRKDSDGLSQLGEGEQINKEYFRNVILKLFCYIEGNNIKEAKALMSAIAIMLKMSHEDKEKIEEAKKNNTLWTNTVHFLKDTFTAKGDVNYYTNEAK